MSRPITQNELKRFFQNATKSVLAINSEVCSSKQEQPKRVPLERVAQRKDKSGPRFEICFRIYASRPCDWDNYWTKCCQDLLIEVGILHGDAWDVLQGRVIPEKADSKDKEEIIITIEKI